MIAGMIGVLALKLRQPLIIGYILTDTIVGPVVLGWASGGSALKLLSSHGIAVLQFVDGPKPDVGLIRSVGPVALETGLGRFVLASLFGFLLALGLGFAPVKAMYVALILAMILLTAFSAAGSGGLAAQAIRLLLVGTAFVIGTAATMCWLMPPLLGRLAQKQELLCRLPWPGPWGWRHWPMG